MFADTAPPQSPSSGCTPGQGGVPDSPVGSLLCGTWAIDGPGAVWQLARTRWPLLLAALAALAALRLGWAVLRRRVWRTHAARARWLQIVPPVTATPVATVGLWRLLATLLPAPRRFTLRPARLAWEVHASADGMRCGLWLPPGVNPTAVRRVLHRAWPGARAEHAPPPIVHSHHPVAAVALVVAQPEWLPIVDDPPRQTSSARWGTSPAEEDRQRAVYDGLASAGRTGGGLLQVHICRAPRRRVALLRRATVNPDRARRSRGGSRAPVVLADALRALIIGVLDFVTPGPSTSSTATRTDPYTAELARQARTKLATAPHLLVAILATATGPTKAAARAAADDITSGFGLLGAHFARRRVRGAATAANRRWLPETRMTLASVTEAAALAGLPAEPAAYGLPAAASRRRAASNEVFTAGPATGNPQTTRQSTSDTSSGDGSRTVWRTP